MRDDPIGIGSPAGRLGRLELLLLKAEREGDLVLAAKCIELAATLQRAQPCGAGNRAASADLPPTPDEAREEIAKFLEKHRAANERGATEDGM